jgi:autotransporter-associated beta strand protein
VPNITLDGGEIDIREGASTGGFNTNLCLVGTVIVGGSSILPAEIHTSGAGANANASLGSLGAPGTIFQVADVAAGDDLTVSSVLRDVRDVASPLTKTGPGAMSLSGANTYTGDTTVLNGELTVNGTSIADSNKLVIDGGKVGVADAANEVVGTLYFGAVQQDSGTYGSTASGATHQDNSRFSGTGLITVTTGLVVTYAQWASVITNGLTARDQDADGDGFTNLNEFLYGTSPIVADGSLTTTQKSGSTLIIHWSERLNSTSAYVLQESTDLSTWTTSAVVPTVAGDQGGIYSASYVRKEAVIPIDSAKKFDRVFATE